MRMCRLYIYIQSNVCVCVTCVYNAPLSQRSGQNLKELLGIYQHFLWIVQRIVHPCERRKGSAGRHNVQPGI